MSSFAPPFHNSVTHVQPSAHHWRGVSVPRNSQQGLHKRCSTIERNTATKNATIKSVPCPLALCIKPGIVMGFFSLRAHESRVHRGIGPRLTCRDSRRKVGLPPTQYSRTLWCFAECWLHDFDLTSRHLEKAPPYAGRGVHRGGDRCTGADILRQMRHPILCKIAHFQTEPLGVQEVGPLFRPIVGDRCADTQRSLFCEAKKKGGSDASNPKNVI